MTPAPLPAPLSQNHLAPGQLPRRDLLRLAAGGVIAVHNLPLFAQAVAAQGVPAPATQAQVLPGLLTKPIPSSGEALPLVGLGTWISFNVGNDPVARNVRVEVMRRFFEAGGRMVDSSPMYGSSQPVVGEALARLRAAERVFSAEKVWTSSGGARQIEQTRQHWGVPRFDLMQVHNLLGWEENLPMLLEMKRAGRLRYVGITTSEGRRHADFERIMRSQPLDFVQLSYNILDREAEQRLLPLARERGIAVIANRPFREGALIRQVQRHPLPPWAKDVDCANWPQLLLKFIVSHPAVTCAIPATGNPEHLRENMGAARGRLPDEAMRRQMAAHVGKL